MKELEKIKKRLLKSGYDINKGQDGSSWVMSDGTEFLSGGDHLLPALNAGLVTKEKTNFEKMLKRGWVRYKNKVGYEVWDIQKTAQVIEDRVIDRLQQKGYRRKYFFIDEKKTDKGYQIFYHEFSKYDFNLRELVKDLRDEKQRRLFP